MNQEKVKSILLEIEKPALEFSLIFSGKASKKVNGLYKPDTHEIILHNQNFKTDNQLMYTAIHEYAHHLITEEHENSALPKKTTRPHTNEFWARFHGLLEVAEEKGFYVLGVDASPELLAITENIKKNYLEKIGILQKELGKHLSQAQALCIASNVRYEDYLERCLQISKKEARSARKISALDITPSIGYENMKMLAAIPSPEKRTEAQQQLRAGKSADSVRSIMKKKAEDVDETVILEKEKTRLEKTITKLSNRLEEIKDIIVNGFSSIQQKQAAMNDEIAPSGDRRIHKSYYKDELERLYPNRVEGCVLWIDITFLWNYRDPIVPSIELVFKDGTKRVEEYQTMHKFPNKRHYSICTRVGRKKTTKGIPYMFNDFEEMNSIQKIRYFWTLKNAHSKTLSIHEYDVNFENTGDIYVIQVFDAPIDILIDTKLFLLKETKKNYEIIAAFVEGAVVSIKGDQNLAIDKVLAQIIECPISPIKDGYEWDINYFFRNIILS